MKYLRFYLPPILWMVTIFVFSSRSRLHVSDVFTIQFAFFKTLHILEYGFLYILWYRALKNTTRFSKNTQFVVPFIITILYALSDELHQTWVPTREGRLRDVGFDATGALVTWYYLWNILPKLPKKLLIWVKNWQLV